VIIKLPFPPSMNHYWRNTQRGTLLSKKGREYKTGVATLLLARGQNQRLEGRLTVRVYLTVPDRRRRDIDNYLKPLLDACNGIVWVDDEQIDKLSIERLTEIEKPGRVLMRVKPALASP